ncbi:energy transducer TonB [Cytophagaceae bacterium ABcell3]|nr:energy transducer TonB [Cytophagaceae bacterium ABcell3]
MKKIIVACFLFALSFSSFAQSGKDIPSAEYYPGGQDSLVAFIYETMVYPPMAKRNRVQGECIVNFVIEADGTVSNIKVVKNIGGGCGDEAKRIVKELQFNAPGYRFETSIPIKFKL